MVKPSYKMDPKLIRVNFICPVCQGLTAAQPVLSEDGFIYHHLCIKEYIDSKNGKLSSPMRGKEYGSTLITLKAFEPTIKILETCEELIDDNGQHDERIADTIIKAKLGDPHHMTTLGRWHLFGEQEGVERDVSYGFKLVENAHEEGYIEATAYYGHCLVRGLGTEKNKTDGYEALVDAHSEGSGAGKDFAAYTLGFCYKGGLHGFKDDEKKATRWLSKVVNKPNDLQIWEYKNDEDENSNTKEQQDMPSNIDSTIGGKLLFDDKHSVSTEATVLTTHENSIDLNSYNGSLENTMVKCKVCRENCKSLLGSVCRNCAD